MSFTAPTENRMRFSSVHHQRGLSLIGLIFFGMIAVGLLVLGFKTVPAVVEYIAVERAIQKIKNEGSTVGEIRAAFDRFAQIDEITSINSRDLDITKEGDQVVVSFAYEKRIPVMDKVWLLIDFSGSTRDRTRKSAAAAP